MKKTLIFLAFISLSLSVKSQNVINLFNKANNFFYYLESAKYDSAHLYINETERPKISADILKQIWEDTKSKNGAIKSLQPIQSRAQGELFFVTMEGVFERDNQNFIVVFNKAEFIVGLFNPPKPVSYKPASYSDTTKFSEISTYISEGNKQLAGIITVPKNAKTYPLVILVHGSGPGDMDLTVGANKPFKDIAAGLAAQGIATLRYVKRTLVYPGDFKGAFTVKEEVINDVNFAIDAAKKIKEVDKKQIYIMGHSLGGMLVSQIAQNRSDVKGVIISASPARKLSDIMIEQNKYAVEKLNDTSENIKAELANAIKLIETTRISVLGEMKPDSVILNLPASYWVSLNSIDQVGITQKLNKRVYVLQGGNDFQVSKTDFDLWENALKSNKLATTKFYPTLNHLLTEQTEKGTTAQYQVPANVSEALILDLANWIKLKP